MRYVSKPTEPTECEAMQWVVSETYPDLADSANEIMAWVNANGGEARYVPMGENTTSGWSGYPRIAVRTINGWAYASPGHYVVMGTATFHPGGERCGVAEDRRFGPHVRDFYPCDPATFMAHWEPVGD